MSMRPIRFRQLRRWHQACEDERLLKLQRPGKIFEASTPFPITNQKELHVWTAANQLRRNREKIVVPLQFE
jgi:hypothetical protein